MLEADDNRVVLQDCFADSEDVMHYHTKYAGNISIQPVSEVQEACEHCWQVLQPAIKVWRSNLDHTTSVNDIFLSLTHQYLPQIVHYNLHDSGTASVIWRISFVNDMPLFKSRMVVLMMRNGWVDPNHEWRVMGGGVGLHCLDVFLWGVVLRKRRQAWNVGSIRRLWSCLVRLLLDFRSFGTIRGPFMMRTNNSGYIRSLGNLASRSSREL